MDNTESKVSPKDQLLYSLTAIIIQLLEERKSSPEVSAMDTLSLLLNDNGMTETSRLSKVIAELGKLVEACVGSGSSNN